LVVALGGASGSAAAQTAVGDSLWRMGRIDEARAAYERAIAEDRNSVRANFRLSQALAWSSNIDSALVLLRAARERVPTDPDLLFTEATYLSWARRWTEALLRFDTLSAAHPGRDYDYVRVARARTLSWAGRLEEARDGYRAVLDSAPNDRDAHFGLAQLRAWSGDLVGAARGYETLLADDPDDPRVLIGLAAVRNWQGRPGTALQLLSRSATRAPDDADAASLRDAIRRTTVPQVSVLQNYSQDTDGNVNRWLMSTARVTSGNVRASLTLGSLAATDPARNSRRRLVEGNVSGPLGPVTLSATLGARLLSPEWRAPEGRPAIDDRQLITWRATAAMPIASRLSATVGVARWPFDEIASLLGRALDIDQQDIVLDWRPIGRLSVTAAATRLAFSDENVRTGGTVRVTYPLPGGFSVGAYGVGFGFDTKSTSYFSPAAFRAAELAAGWGRETPTWSASLSGGYGRQRVERDLPTQEQWHLDARATRQITTLVSLEVFGGRSTSAAASAVGAYRYDLLGIGLHLRAR
jgi:tetratricopeptide (TPR) repeat protein